MPRTRRRQTIFATHSPDIVAEYRSSLVRVGPPEDDALRHDPEAVLNAHIMDPLRREGIIRRRSTDRLFLLWILGPDRAPNARVAEIDEVDLPGVTVGGSRGRLLAFAARIIGEPARIRFLADADMARLNGDQIPGNVWLTDLRDLEGYLFRVECVDKALVLGAGVDGVDVLEVLGTVTRLARRLAALRSLSLRTGLELPIQALDLPRYTSTNNAIVEVDFQRVLQVLMQNAGLSLANLDNLMAQWDVEAKALAGVSDDQLIHGKDVMCLLSEVRSATASPARTRRRSSGRALNEG